MAQFIYLSLLLATIQLSLAKVTITCDLAGNGKAECDCFLCNANCPEEVITKLRQDNGTYLCNDRNPKKDQCKKKAKDCTKLDLQVDVDVASPAAEECWKRCTDYPSCQYVKFYLRNKKCFLISSRYNKMARLSTYNASWWSSLRNCKVSKNGPEGPSSSDHSDGTEDADSGGSSSSDPSDGTEDAGTTPVNPSTEDSGGSSSSDPSDGTEDAGTTPVNPSTEGPEGPSSSDPSDGTEDAGTTPVNPSTEDSGGSSSSDPSDGTEDAGTTPVNPSTEGPEGPSSSDPSDVTEDAGTTPVNPSTEGLKFIEEEKSWIYALDHCYRRTSSLVQITNITVWNAVKSLLQNKTELQKGVWIGLERSIFGKPDRPWKWISGCVAKDNAPPWNSSLVDPLNNHCGKIIRDEKSEELKWGDGDCHDKLPFICQGKLNYFP